MLSFSPWAGTTDAAYALITGMSTALAPVGGAVAAIVVFTVAVRLLLHPLTRIAVRGERAKSRLAPQVAELRRKHGKDITALTEKLSALYRAERISPFAGILPMLAQVPFFIVMFQIFANSSIAGHPNRLLAEQFFGVSLGSRLLVGGAGLGLHLAVFLGLFAALGVLAWIASRRAAMLTQLMDSPPTGLLARVSRVLPYAILVSAAVLPLAAGVYLMTTTAWTAAENALLKRGVPVTTVDS